MTSFFARDLVRTFRKNAPDMSPFMLPSNIATVYRPGVQLSNLAFENPRHRKLHIETTRVGMVQSVHSTLYPRPQFEAPILTMDLVTIGGTVTHASVDAYGVLSEEYDDAFRGIQARYDSTEFTNCALDCVAMHLQYCKTLEISSKYNRASHQRFSKEQREKMRALRSNAFGGDMALTDEYVAMIFD